MEKIITRCFTACLLTLFFPATYAQQPGNALDYMLQRPAVTKHYENKRFGDHFFIDAGAGANLMGRNQFKPGIHGELHFGDWITPEHGLRLGLNAGALQTKSQKTKFTGVSLDYLMNISAIANRTYPTAKIFEVYGIAGADLKFSHFGGNEETGWGVHLGLRGQYAFSPYTYLYIEPTAGLLSDNVPQSPTWRKFQPVLSLTMGAGYRLRTGIQRHKFHKDSIRHHHWGDGVFLSILGGPTFIAKENTPSSSDQIGGRLAVGIGKLFNPYHGLRLSAGVAMLNQPMADDFQSVYGQVDYMLNMHNMFGGPNPNRRWWTNLLVGASGNLNSEGGRKRSSLGLGGGFQGVFRLNSGLRFVLEPRIDLYNTPLLPNEQAGKSWQVVPSALAGLQYTYNAPHLYGEIASCDFEKPNWRAHTFIESGGGLNLPISRNALNNIPVYVGPQIYLGIGKWFSSLHGMRVWGQVAKTEYFENKTYEHGEIGIDYLFNLTNAINGYQPQRIFDLAAGLGVNLSARKKRMGPFFGMNASIKGTWYFNPLLGIFIEPRLQGYGKRYLPTTLGNSRVDWIASATAGLQVNLRGYNHQALHQEVEESGGLRSSLSFAAGIATQANQLRNTDYLTPVARVGYTQWFTPLSAWRAQMQISMNKAKGSKYAAGTVGADYLTDLTAHTYGYDPLRVFSLSALVGLNMGLDYTQEQSRFLSDLHAGCQLAIRVSDNTHLQVEPQLAYRMSKRFKGERASRFMPQIMLGVDYSFKRALLTSDIPAPEKRHFVSAAFGMGAYSPTFGHIKPNLRKFTFVSKLGYGQWLTGIHGVEGNLSTTHVQRYGEGSENVTSIRANYMMNVRSAITGETTDDKVFQLTGLAGASLHISSYKGRKAQVVPGLQMALQTGWRVSPSVELFAQPEAALFSSRIIPGGTSRPFDGDFSITIGTKYRF